MIRRLEKFFELRKHKTDFKTEVLAGITTFMTMAYILAVNPSILSAAGMDSGAVFTATILASFVGTILMGLVAKYPFALAPGMGLNAFFAYTVVIGMGYSWQFALTAVLVEGIIFVILSLTKVREAIFNSIPQTLKYAVSAGIGLFIAFIGLQNAKIVVPNASTGVSFFGFGNNSFRSLGITVVLAIIGIVITGILLKKEVKGGILYGILITWLLGILCQVTGLYVPSAELGTYSLIPDFSNGISIPSIGSTFCQFEFTNILTLDFIVTMFSFLFVDMFDTVGTVIGTATKAKMLDEEGKLPRIKQVFLADSIATISGSCFGTSTTTTYVESASGIAVGGRTGLTAVVTALLFLCALPLSPIFLAIPSFATAPALIIVGFMMLSSILKVDFNDLTEAIPAYLCVIMMPFAYSISDGICAGIVSYVVINLFVGKAKEKKIHWLLYVLTIIFILKYALL